MSKTPLYWLAGILTIIGSLFFGYKWMYMGYPLLPGTSADIWQIEVKLSFNAANEPIKVGLYVPGNNRKFTLLDENFISRGFGLSTVRDNGNRRAIWSVRTANGAQALYYRTTVEQFDSGTDSDMVRVMPEVMDHGFTGAEFEVAKNILQSAQQQSADLDTLVAQLVKRANDPADDDIALLLKGDRSVENRIRITTRLLALAYVPARMMHGLYMVERRGDAPLEPWLEVFDEKNWRPFDPITGQTGVADNYLVFWRGDDSLVNIDGAENVQTRISLQKLELEAVEAAAARRHYLSPVLEGMSLSSLPLATQNVYKILLLIPIGA
ncbi:MAG: UUP1 family membrane protein, partial [Balneolales bacterium]